jgi:AbrB family looped-hinge helix DNA binding protein
VTSSGILLLRPGRVKLKSEVNGNGYSSPLLQSSLGCDLVESAISVPLTDGNWHNKMARMNAKLTIDKAGRIVLPKPLRDELQLAPGDALELECSAEEITLRPLRGNAPLRKKRGVWVFRVGEPLAGSVVEETIRQVRNERNQAKRGKE